MSLFNLLLSLSFIDQVLLVEAVNSTRNDTNRTLSQASAHTTLMLEKLFDGYDKRLRPNFAGPPCKIDSSMHVYSMVPIKEIDMEVAAVVFFRQHWTDPRLAYGPSLGIPKIRLVGNIRDQVWLPDTYFVNDLSDAKSVEDFLFELTQEGQSIYSYRKTLRLYCPMNLRKYPMDEQVCEMKFESYSYAVEDVTFTWLSSKSLRIDKDLHIPQYTLVAWDQESHVNEYSIGNYTSLSATFRLKRELGFYVLQEFIPTILIVALSWVGFWIDERSVPARVSLGITTVLALTTLMFGIQATLPRVGHVKAIDVFLLGSFVFVFAALVEYAIICTFSNVFTSRADESSKKRLQPRMNPSALLEECNNREINGKENGTFHRVFETKKEEIQAEDHHNEIHNPSLRFLSTWFSMKPGSHTTKLLHREPCAIDKRCRKLFPMAYALFLLIFFVVYRFADI